MKRPRGRSKTQAPRPEQPEQPKEATQVIKPKQYIMSSNIMNLPQELIGNIIGYMPVPTLIKNDDDIMVNHIRLQYKRF